MRPACLLKVHTRVPEGRACGFFFYDLASTVWGIKEYYILIIKRIINSHLNGPRLWGGKAVLQCYEP